VHVRSQRQPCGHVHVSDWQESLQHGSPLQVSGSQPAMQPVNPPTPAELALGPAPPPPIPPAPPLPPLPVLADADAEAEAVPLPDEDEGPALELDAPCPPLAANVPPLRSSKQLAAAMAATPMTTAAGAASFGGRSLIRR
jgi:hypothetical protein